MEDIFRAIGLYDLVGHLLPGCVLLFSCLAAANAYWWSKGQRFHEPHPATFLVTAYIIGFMLQTALSPTREWSIFSLPLVGSTIEEVFKKPKPDNPYEAKARDGFVDELRKTSQQAFAVPAEERFYLAEAYVRARELDSFPAIMQARHAFARGLVMSFFFSAMAFAYAAVAYGKTPPKYVVREWGGGDKPDLFGGYLRIAGPANARPQAACWLFVGLCLLGARLAYMRAEDFDRYQKEAIFRIFYADYKTRTSANASPSKVEVTFGAPAR